MGYRGAGPPVSARRAVTMTPGLLGFPGTPKMSLCGDMRGQRLSPSSLRVFPLTPSFGVGETPRLIEQLWSDPHQPWGARPFPRDIGLCQPVPTWRLVQKLRGVGTILLPWLRGMRAPAAPLDEPKPCPSVCPSRRCCGVLAQLPWPGAPPGLSRSGTGLRVSGCAVLRGQSQVPAQP